MPDLRAAAFDLSPNPYMVVDRDLRYVAANRAYLAVTGRTLDDLVGQRVIDVFPHDPSDPENQSRNRLTASLRRVLATGDADVLPLIHYRILGDDRYWSATHTPMRDERGEVAWVLQHTVDVTHLYAGGRAAPAVEAGVIGRAEVVEQRNRTLDADLRALLHLFDEAPAFLCYLRGPDLVFDLANRAYRDLVGGRPLIGRPVREALAEIGGPYFALLEQVAATGEPFVGQQMTVTLRRDPSGPPVEAVVDFVYQPIRGADGATLGVLVLGSDVTERHQAQARLAQLARVLDETRDFVGIADLDGWPSFVNHGGRELLGLPEGDAFRSMRVEDAFVERQRQRVLEEVIPAALRDGWWEGDLLFLHQRTGEEIPVRYAAFPLRDGSGRAVAVATITRDLRRERAAEEERARLLEAERVARAEAEEANRSKDQFLATISHELRTPLTSMLGWMSMIRSGRLPPDKHAQALDTIERNARVQAQLIDDLLDVGRIVSGKLVLDLEPVDVSTVVAQAVETVRPSAQAKGVELSLALDATAVVRADPRRLQQVVWNLVANAVKFTPGHGHVRIELERRGAEVLLRVVDDGAGIAPELLPHVFERFRQGDAGSARRSGGLGLGLSIVKHVVEAHGGAVTAASGGEGRGATFEVRLPTLRAETWRGETPTPAPPFSAPLALAGVHVLLVDDERDVRDYVRHLLEDCRAEVTVATSAAEALRLLQVRRPDVLLSDLAMPGEDGFSLIARVRALSPDHGGRTPAIALTAYGRAEDRARAMRAGFQNHVTKPVAPDELVAVVNALAAR